MGSDAPAVADSLGRYLRDLRVSVTDRCNFRCPYCMPAEVYGDHYHFLPKGELLTFEEITRIARICVSLGVTKIRITGGEPLLRRDLPRLVAMLAEIDGVEDLALTTNGYHLAEHAAALRKAGLRRVTVSLDSLDEEEFQRLNGRGLSVVPVLAGIETAAAVGLGPIKINCVVVRGVNDHSLVGLARRFRGSGHIVRFIEYMDVGTLNGWKLENVVRAREIVERLDRELGLTPLEPNYRGEVARRYAYRDGSGEIGIIASVSAPFCGDCTRARLSSDGRLVTCLFATDGHDLKAALRGGASDEELRQRVTGIWRRREDRYSELRAERLGLANAPVAEPKIEMYRLGG